jgi:hypothetical protein
VAIITVYTDRETVTESGQKIIDAWLEGNFLQKTFFRGRIFVGNPENHQEDAGAGLHQLNP